MATLNKIPRPWYRQPWPWFLIAPPAVAVIAGIITIWLAVSTSDGLVVDDYYKQGLTIEKAMERSRRSAELGLEAHVRLSADRLDLDLSSKAPGAVPDRVLVTLSHPTRMGLDQTIVLSGAQGHFVGSHKDLTIGRWNIQIEDESRTWRLNGIANPPTETEIRIVPVISRPVD